MRKTSKMSFDTSTTAKIALLASNLEWAMKDIEELKSRLSALEKPSDGEKLDVDFIKQRLWALESSNGPHGRQDAVRNDIRALQVAFAEIREAPMMRDIKSTQRTMQELIRSNEAFAIRNLELQRRIKDLQSFADGTQSRLERLEDVLLPDNWGKSTIRSSRSITSPPLISKEDQHRDDWWTTHQWPMDVVPAGWPRFCDSNREFVQRRFRQRDAELVQSEVTWELGRMWDALPTTMKEEWNYDDC